MEAVKELPLSAYGTISKTSPLHVISLFSAIVIAGIVGLAIERLVISPLAKIPGPKLAALTQWWIIYHEFNGDRTVTIHKLHEKYGPVVRVSPTEVSFTSPDGVKDIYGAGSTFPKSHFYDLFQYYGERNMFTTLTKKEHGTRKKMITDRYSKSYVMQPGVEASVQSRVREFMAEINKAKILDMYMFLHYYALEYYYLNPTY
jgi:Cytochrome P450